MYQKYACMIFVVLWKCENLHINTVTGAVHYTAGATPLILQDLYCN